MSDDEPVFTPSKFAEHAPQVRGMKREETRIPPRLIIVYSSRHLKYLQKITHSKPVKWWYSRQRPLHAGYYRDKPISLLCNWIGAPAASMMLEEVIAFGAKKIIEVGEEGWILAFGSKEVRNSMKKAFERALQALT